MLLSDNNNQLVIKKYLPSSGDDDLLAHNGHWSPASCVSLVTSLESPLVISYLHTNTGHIVYTTYVVSVNVKDQTAVNTLICIVDNRVSPSL